MTRRRKGVYGPALGKRCVLFIDDLTACEPAEGTSTRSPLETIRHWLSYECVYDARSATKKELVDMVIISTAKTFHVSCLILSCKTASGYFGSTRQALPRGIRRPPIATHERHLRGRVHERGRSHCSDVTTRQTLFRRIQHRDFPNLQGNESKALVDLIIH